MNRQKIKIVFLLTNCKKSGPVQQMLNIIRNLNQDEFEPFLVTLYAEDKETSQLQLFLPHVKHVCVPTGKSEVILGRDKHLRNVLDEICPDVIHSLGVFPDYAVSRMKKWKQIITLRNFVYEDYPAKFGWLRGNILAIMQLYAMKHTSKTVACSESLARVYREKLGLEYGFIRNGVDVEQFCMPTKDKKMSIRRKLNIPEDAFVFVYVGQMIERKNVGFLLDTFVKQFKDRSVMLLLLGNGALLESFKDAYGNMTNIDFRGNVSNVNLYLMACDAYVSASKSEGLPNGVLEAMAVGLPVVLSDIEQHLEIYNIDKRVGFVYRQGDSADFVRQLSLVRKDSEARGFLANQCAIQHFSANAMSKTYQMFYRQIVEQ